MTRLAYALTAVAVLQFVALAQSTGTLTGKVEDQKGKPVAGVVIRVMKSRDRSVQETQTDSSGKYAFQLEADHYTVSFDAEGYQPVTLVAMQQVEEGKETEVKPVQLQKAKRTSLVRGAVFDTRGFGIPGATVKLERIATEDEAKSGKRVQSLRRDYITNNRGEFAFRLPPDRARYRLTAVRSGYKSDSKVVDVSESEAVPVAFSLEPVKQ
jgi:5-hydroxyisourate hydrolase-like protein (transthyretin family)